MLSVMTLLKRHLLRRDKIVSDIGEINVQNLKKILMKYQNIERKQRVVYQRLRTRQNISTSIKSAT